MKLMPIVYVTDMERSIAFYRALGFEVDVAGTTWTQLAAGERAILALHATPEAHGAGANPVELAFIAEEPLEVLLERLREHGIEPARGIADEAFGRSVVLRDPDGLPLQVNEHDRERSTQNA